MPSAGRSRSLHISVKDKKNLRNFTADAGKLTNQVMKHTAVITGGTKGIGKALIEKAALNGYDIITCARGEEFLEALQEEIEEKFDCTLLYQRTDLSVTSEVKAFGEFVLHNTEKVDLLINNAGLFIPGSVHSEAEGALEEMIHTNLYSAYHLTRILLPRMMKRKKGHIFNMCSTASIIPYVNGGSYCISKFALLGMSKVLREEMKEHGIRVTSVMPGATLTASWEGTELPESRFMKAGDVAEAVWTAYELSKHTVMEELILRPQLGDI